MKKRVFVVGLVGLITLSGCGTTSNYEYDSYYGNDYESDAVEIDRYDLQNDVNGTYEVEACSSSGCYDLEADISSGELETIYFDNGGYIDDPEGEGWELSNLPDEAYEDAYENNYDPDEYYYDEY